MPLDTQGLAQELLDSRFWVFQVGFHRKLQPSLPSLFWQLERLRLQWCYLSPLNAPLVCQTTPKSFEILSTSASYISLIAEQSTLSVFDVTSRISSFAVKTLDSLPGHFVGLPVTGIYFTSKILPRLHFGLFYTWTECFRATNVKKVQLYSETLPCLLFSFSDRIFHLPVLRKR